MSYEFYKIAHVTAALLLFTSLGTLAATAGSKSGRFAKLAGIAHGVALTVILVAGFGLLARLNLMAAIPIWVWLKMSVWLALALILLPLRRKPEWAAALWILIPILGGFAAWAAIWKPH
jgi:heme A synthase